MSTKSSPKPVARQTIARSARSGWLTGERQGREVRWQLSAAAKHLIEEGIGRIYSLHNRSEQWDGNWLILLVTVPNSHRDVRKRLYSALDWAGFGNPSAGVWLNPYPEREAEFRRIVHEVRLGEWMLCFRASVPSRSAFHWRRSSSAGGATSTLSRPFIRQCSSATRTLARWMEARFCVLSSRW